MEVYDKSNIVKNIVKIDGVSTIQGGVYDELNIDGVVTALGDISANKLDIDGVCTCEANVEAKVFKCDGVLTIGGNLRAGVADIDGVLTISGGKLEADSLKCDGVLTATEISADEIDANGKVNAREIVGDHVVVRSYWRNGLVKLLFRVGQKTKFRFSEIELIEATTVDVRGVRANTVSGQIVTIGKYCEIDRVDCTGTLRIDPSAKIGEITGEHTRV